MKFDRNIIDELTGQQVAGIISPEDEHYLNELISQDEEAFAYWQSIQSYYQSVDVEQLKGAYDENVALLNVWDNIGRRRIIRRRIRTYSIAAISILAVGMLTYMLLPSRKPAPEIVKQDEPASIQLTLPNGKTIDLSTTEGQVAVAEATLKNTNKVLSYTTKEETSAGGIATLTVPVGKDYMLQLSDGSEIWLNSATTVKFPFTFGENREITISGEGYVKVAANAEKPFLVHLGGSTVQVLGTEFNVNTYNPEKIRVALVSGSVMMKLSGSEKVIKPGYEAICDQDENIRTARFDEDYTLAWRRGVYKFDDLPLQEICEMLPRWFGLEPVMDNQKIAVKRFTGQLERDKPLEKQLELFKKSTEMDYYIKDGKVHFR